MLDSTGFDGTSIHDEHGGSFGRSEKVSALTKFVMKFGIKDKATAEKVMIVIAVLFFVTAFFVAAISFGWFKMNKATVPTNPGVQSLRSFGSQNIK